MNMVHKEEK